MEKSGIKAKILYVEDDISLSFVTKDNLEMQGYEIVHCANGLQGLESYQQQRFDLCILDVMLPQMDGFSLAQRIRELDKHIPIIFLTAKNMKEDRLAGLRIGADDYLTKPFSIEELLLKIEVFLRRNRINNEFEKESENELTIGQFVFDMNELNLAFGNQNQKLTLREAQLLQFFAQNTNVTLKREDILKKIWGDDDYFNGRSLDVFISRLRKYLKADPKIQIENVHGVGFKMWIK